MNKINWTSSSSLVQKAEEAVIKKSLDIIILSIVNDNPSSGYGILKIIYKNFNVKLSAGTIYTLLYSLEREGLLDVSLKGRVHYYILTNKGKERPQLILTAQNRLKKIDNTFSAFLRSFLFYKK